MSHFSVMVIGDNPGKQLEPFQEENEKYYEFVDCTKEVSEEWENGTTHEFYSASSGSWGHELSAEEFAKLEGLRVGEAIIVEVSTKMDYLKPDGKYRAYYKENSKRCDNYDVWFHVIQFVENNGNNEDALFDGTARIRKIDPPKEIQLKDQYLNVEDLAENWLEYQRDKTTGKWGYYSNPNPKWDWCKLGGRWLGFFKLKEGADKYSRQEIGTSGTGNNKPIYDCDRAIKKAIDFEYMIEATMMEASVRYDEAMKYFGHLPRNRSWETIMREHKDRDKAREVYFNQLRCEFAANDKDCDDFLDYNQGVDEFLIDKDTYVENAESAALATFAVVKDGEWYERGKMGWWGIVSDEEDRQEWNNKINELIDGLPDDTLLSVYDCHI